MSRGTAGLRRAHGAPLAGRAARRPSEGGYAMAALLVGISVMSVVISAALPVWTTQSKRVKEDELVFRGEQYARAIMLYQRKYANALPPSIDVLVNERFLRKRYLDPITGQDFQPLTGAVGQSAPGAGSGGGASTPGRQGGQGGGTSAGTGASSGGTGSNRGTSSFGPVTGSQGQGRTSSFGAGGGTAPTSGRGAVGSPGGFGAAGGIVGVASRSKEKSLRLYNGRDVYSDWTFVPVQRQLQAGGGEGSSAPGTPGGRGQSTPGASNQSGRGGARPGTSSFGPISNGSGSGGSRSGGSSGGFGRR